MSMKSFKGKTNFDFSILADQDINLLNFFWILASTIDFYDLQEQCGTATL